MTLDQLYQEIAPIALRFEGSARESTDPRVQGAIGFLCTFMACLENEAGREIFPALGAGVVRAMRAILEVHEALDRARSARLN